MAKIKLSLPSGSEVEKTVLSYFNNNGNYIIFDAESVGSMGLPIILVSKIDNDKVVKISDQNEWQQVKGYLKSIISGEAVNYLSIPETMSADEVFYTQLTLPVASFDTLKNSYKAPDGAASKNVAPTTAEVSEPAPADAVADNLNAVANAIESEPVANDLIADSAPANDVAVEPVNMSTTADAEAPAIGQSAEEVVSDDVAAAAEDVAIANPIVEEAPIANEGLTAAADIPVVEDVAPVVEADNITNPVEEAPVEVAPVVAEAPIVADVTPIEEDPAPVAVEPIVASDPIVDSASNDDSAKERFMKACEDLYEAIKMMK